MNTFAVLLGLLELYQGTLDNLKIHKIMASIRKKERRPLKGDLIMFSKKWPYVLGKSPLDDKILKKIINDNPVMIVIECKDVTINRNSLFKGMDIKKFSITALANNHVISFTCNDEAFFYVE